MTPDANRRDVILITEAGYLRLVKSLNDDRAWDVQEQLVETYFRDYGYFSMTFSAKAFGKDLSRFIPFPDTLEYMKELSRSADCAELELVRVYPATESDRGSRSLLTAFAELRELVAKPITGDRPRKINSIPNGNYSSQFSFQVVDWT